MKYKTYWRDTIKKEADIVAGLWRGEKYDYLTAVHGCSEAHLCRLKIRHNIPKYKVLKAQLENK